MLLKHFVYTNGCKNADDIKVGKKTCNNCLINLLSLQRFPKYPDVQPPKQNPFVELHVPVGKQYKLHWSRQFAPNVPFSQPLIFKHKQCFYIFTF